MRIHPRLAALYREKTAEGWTVTTTGGNHLRWSHSSGAFTFTSSTPSDKGAEHNIRRDLRRALQRAA